MKKCYTCCIDCLCGSTGQGVYDIKDGIDDYGDRLSNIIN